MTGRASVREALRAATRETHQRLHRHAGLSAAARGAIGLDDYRQLLMRLYGFHLGLRGCSRKRHAEARLDREFAR